MTPYERAYYSWLMNYLGGLRAAYGEGYFLKTYLAASGISKLQLGSGSAVPEGWLGTDIFPQSDRVMYLDAAKPYPFGDDTFEYVHSEHLIEHLSWQEGLSMLRECRRVMKPGGTIRVATPDLEVLIGLYTNQGDPLNKRYVEWITDACLDGVNVYKAAFVINNAFRNWGHQFLYDGETLEMAMRAAGFTDIVRRRVGESEDENLRGIESHGELTGNEEMVAFETMVFEGTCTK
jgi:predicted SAM-dependent methyltransferase